MRALWRKLGRCRLSDISSPYLGRNHNVGKSAGPPPHRPKERYSVRQDGQKYAVYFGERRCMGFFVNRFSAQLWADSANKTINDPTSQGED